MPADGEASFKDVYLKQFASLNPHCAISVEGGSLLIGRPWGGDDVRLRAEVSDQQFIDDLNKLVLNPKFDAVYHVDINVYEFIYAYFDPKEESYLGLADRKFTFNFMGHTFECEFAEPTSRLMRLAKSFEPLPTDALRNSAPQLLAFKDAQDLESLPPGVKRYFEGKIARNFFIKPQGIVDNVSFEKIARHVNFILTYYDRLSPNIVIKDTVPLTEQKVPLRMATGAFPAAVALSSLDDIVLKLMESARVGSPRFAFIYYYQVLEYAGYYYIDDKAKKELRNFLKDPALINCSEDKVAELFSIISDLGHNDDVKMRRIVEDYCDPDVVWREIEHDKGFFSSEHTFEGGFICAPLIGKDTSIETWRAMWMPKTFDVVTKIRNVLVHAREKRENKVILPTRANDSLLRAYIPVVRRIAEQVALKAE